MSCINLSRSLTALFKFAETIQTPSYDKDLSSSKSFWSYGEKTIEGIPYCAAIDMWSFGCILYELYVGYPLFPGEDEKDHMALMMEVKGIPPRSVLVKSSRRKVFFDDDYNPMITPNSRGKIRMPGNKNLYTLMNCSDRDFVDFIDVSTPLLFIFDLYCNLEMY